MVFTAANMLLNVWPLHVQAYLPSATRQEGGVAGGQVEEGFMGANRTRGELSSREAGVFFDPKPKAQFSGKFQEKSSGESWKSGGKSLACAARLAEDVNESHAPIAYMGRKISSSTRRFSVGRMRSIGESRQGIQWWAMGDEKTKS